MLQVYISPYNFLEKIYILDVLLGEFLGLEYQVVVDENIVYYKIVIPNKNQLIIADQFFGKFVKNLEYLCESNLPHRIQYSQNDFLGEKNIPVIFGNIEVQAEEKRKNISLNCGIDIFASCFFMLTRWEEYAKQARDNHRRFPAKASLAHKEGFLDRPVVNEYVEMLWNMLTYLGCNQNRKKHYFNFVPTHDVDRPFYWQGVKHVLRIIAGDMIKRKHLMMAIRNLKSFCAVKVGRSKDPFDTFDGLMDYSENINVRSHFFFKGGGTNRYESTYDVKKNAIQSLMKKINRRGHIIGFHPSYKTYDEPNKWEEEFKDVQKVSPQTLKTGRQHNLNFDVPITWQIWDDYNMSEDMTMSYPEKEGFRCGVCWPYPVFNILSRKRLKLLERPLILMDSTLVKYQNLTPDAVLKRISLLVDKVRKYNGDFVFLWHNSSLGLDPWKKYENVYQNILSF